MTVSVVVPWRPDGAERDAAWAWVASMWGKCYPDWQLVVGRGGDGPWCKATAVAEGLADATGDILVVADADCWTDGVEAAVRAVEAGAAWAIPHHLVHRLTAAATADVLRGLPLGGRTVQRPYPGYPGGGITVVRRDVYAEVPLDPRFLGWGQEDESWAHALTVLAGRPWRGTAPLWHLWHPPQPRRSRRWGSTESRRLYERYRAAAAPDDVRALLAEIDD